MEDEILSLLSDDNFLERSIDLLAKKLECTSSEKFIQLVKLMNNLEESGKIVRNKYNHYYLPFFISPTNFVWPRLITRSIFPSGFSGSPIGLISTKTTSLLKASFKLSGEIKISFSWPSTATKPKPFLLIVYDHDAPVEFPKNVYDQIESIPDALDGIDVSDRVFLMKYHHPNP